MAMAALCGAQTTVNGGRDFKGTLKASGTSSLVDFSAAGNTIPAKTGTLASRPTACTQGQVYFATDATAGQNLSLCTTTGSPGTWTTIAGSGGGGSAGAGVSYCAPASASGTAYTCAPSPALSSYAAGVTVALIPDVSATGGATTLNVNSLGAKSVKGSDGSTNPQSGDLTAGRLYFLTYDGTVFRIERGVQAKTSVSHQFLTAINADGTVTAAQPAASDVSGLATSATTDATNASNITSGTLAAARGGAGTISGILKANGSGTVSAAVSGTDYISGSVTVNGHALSGAVVVSASDLTTGTLPAAQLPLPTTSTIGGVNAKDCTGTGHIVKIGTDGSVTCTSDGVGATGQPPYTTTFASSATWSIPHSTHGFTSTALIVETYDASGNRIQPNSVTVDQSTYDITITWTNAQAGRVVINGTVGPQGPTGPSGTNGTNGTNGSGFNGRGTYASMTASSPAANDTWELTDAVVSGACSVGGGSAKAVCVYNGSTWVSTASPKICVIDNDAQSTSALSASQISGRCVVPAAATVLEIDVVGGTGTVNGTPAAPTVTGTGSVAVGKYTPSSGSSTTNLMSAQLATASGKACALPAAGTATCSVMGVTQAGSSLAISTTALAAGDVLYISAATPDGVQTWYQVAIVYRLN